MKDFLPHHRISFGIIIRYCNGGFVTQLDQIRLPYYCTMRSVHWEGRSPYMNLRVVKPKRNKNKLFKHMRPWPAAEVFETPHEHAKSVCKNYMRCKKCHGELDTIYWRNWTIFLVCWYCKQRFPENDVSRANGCIDLEIEEGVAPGG